MTERRRIALYGGTFDPVHVGHIAVAQHLLKLFALDQVLFIPAHAAPHKRERKGTPGLHRYAMLVLATQPDARLLVSTVELDAPGRPYTFDTLSRMRDELGRAARLFFVMGADSWSEITTWHKWEQVLALTDQIVVARPSYSLSATHVSPQIRERIIDLQGAQPVVAARKVDEGDGPKIYLTDVVMMDVSATAIRRAVREGRSAEVASLVPSPVADYVEKYGLYRDQHETEFFDQGTDTAS